jgi:hypothetical protein
MAPFLFRCPNTGYRVQGWAAKSEPEGGRDVYESVTFLACRGVHMVNLKTGKTLGEDE